MKQGYGIEAMFFLLRVGFWLTVVLALLPSGGAKQGAPAQVGASDAVSAAGAAVSDVSGFCDRQPDACVVGAQAAIAIGQRAQAGAKMVYDLISDHGSRGATGSVSATKVSAVHAVPAFPGSQSTLKSTDLEPVWQGPPARTEYVPLPRPRRDSHRKT